MKTIKNLIKTCLLIGLLLALPAVVHAQFGYSNNGNGTCTITNYTGSGGTVTIPAMERCRHGHGDGLKIIHLTQTNHET